MPFTFDWNGNSVGVVSRFAGKYLFLATETTVRVNGRPVASSGGFTRGETAVGQFEDKDGEEHQIDVQSSVGVFALITADYLARVDGRVVAQGKGSIENALPMLLFLLLFVLVLGWELCLLVGMLFLAVVTMGLATM